MGESANQLVTTERFEAGMAMFAMFGVIYGLLQSRGVIPSGG